MEKGGGGESGASITKRLNRETDTWGSSSQELEGGRNGIMMESKVKTLSGGGGGAGVENWISRGPRVKNSKNKRSNWTSRLRLGS